MVERAKAAVLVELNRPLELMDLTLPSLKRGQVLVDVHFSGVCHTQINEARGLKGPDRFLPHCMGHEGVGTIATVGEGVTKVAPGDRVVLSWLKGTGADVPGTVYQSTVGSVNSGAIATFMDRTITCENRVTLIPRDIPSREAALLGCAIPTGAGIVLNSAKVQAGQSVAVFGVGGIGLSAVMAAAGLGATPIIAVDISIEKLNKALRMGATHAVNIKDPDPLGAIHALTGGRGVDIAVEAAGRTEVMELAFESVRTGGGQCIIAGNPPVGHTVRLNPFSLIQGRNIRGSWGGDSNPDRDIPRYIDMFRSGSMKLSGMISQEYPLEQVNEALEDLEAGRVFRPILKLRTDVL
jgi:S-(hydroxymethyl)glutathione dehydrogenase / alcohol dehydrogenase